MSLFLKKTVKDAAIGIWEINETVEELFGRVKLSRKEKQYYSLLKSPLRKKHWLSYRLILPHLVKREELSNIHYDEFGKPHLDNGVRHLSVAHSGKFSAMIVSPTKSVGIDIEAMSPKISKISHKFLNKKELKQDFSGHAMESLYLIWSGKEALYKLYGKRDLLFRENFRIFPFEFQQEGTITGEISCDDFHKEYPLHYQTIENYILVYAIDQ